VEKAKACKNSYGLDLFKYKGHVFEGRSGMRFINEAELINLASIIQSAGGIEGFNKKVEEALLLTGESPRYTRPDARKRDIFPPSPKKKKIIQEVR
jgi:hypothetical protein